MTQVIYVKTSDTCNLHCDHCFTSGRNGNKTRWDVNATIEWIQEYMTRQPEQEHCQLVIHGGEPLLADIGDLEYFVDYFMALPRYGISITTNLVLKLDERKQALLKRIGHIGTSWDVNVRFENDKQKALWEKNVALIQSLGIPVTVFVSVNRALTDMDIDSFLNEMERNKPEAIRLERLTLDGNAYRNPAIFPDNEQQDLWFLAIYKRYQQRRNELSYKISTLDIVKDKVATQVVKTDTNCRDCEQNLVTMNADGGLSGCPNAAASNVFSQRDEGVDVFLGSEKRLDAITHELDFHPNCLQCDVFHLCGGDCHQLPWQGDRCGGLKHLLRYVRDQYHQPQGDIAIAQIG